MKYVCPVCGYIYDDSTEAVPFARLPDSWVCPVCQAPKALFTLQVPETNETPADAYEPEPASDEGAASAMPEDLSEAQLAALLSNLARGCEKQYKPREARLFGQLADYYAGLAPNLAMADLDMLSGLIEQSLNEHYKALEAVAREQKDRGALRALTWGRKVTNMQQALLARYQREGEDFLRDTRVWMCSVCGFIYVGDEAPAICPVCKVPGWKFEQVEGGARA